MTAVDPFAEAPADDEATRYGDAPNPTDSPVESVAVKKKPASKKLAVVKKEETPLSESKITVTLKGGAGFDAPWVVVHADDLQEAHEVLTDPLLDLVQGAAQKAAESFRGLNTAAPAAAPARPGAPTPPPGAPGPDWTYKEGVGKTGKPWKAWMPPRDQPGLSPVWL